MTKRLLPVDGPASSRTLRWRWRWRWRWNMQSQGRRQRAFAGLFVVALHVALGALWHASVTGLPRHAGPAPAQRLSVRLIPWRAAPTPLPPRAEAPAVRPTRSAPAAALSRPRMPAPTDRITPPPMPLDRAVVTVTPAEAALRPEASASAAVAAPALLDTEASRRAIRASARTPSLSALAAAASDEPRPAGAQERLGDGVKAAGKGDCLKGEYAGAGMGILSLPFIALAAARGACGQ